MATLSLDLDNLWSYMKTHGDAGWEDYPSFLNCVVPRQLDFFAAHGLAVTVFVVGRDAIRRENRSVLAAITAAGHEIGNHSFQHDQWIHLFTPEEIEKDLIDSEQAIGDITGYRPTGFRGPGYSLSEPLLAALLQRGYRYDASTCPTYIGPLARAYYLLTFKGSSVDEEKRRHLFGGFGDGRRPLEAYRWKLAEGCLLEIPVTTLPVLRLPFHTTYLFYLAEKSRALARRYFRFALSACRAAGIAPSLILHPTDFLGCDDPSAPAYFPGMRLRSHDKRALLDSWFGDFTKMFKVIPIGCYAGLLTDVYDVPERTPDFPPRPRP